MLFRFYVIESSLSPGNNGLEVGDLLLSIEGLGLRGMTHEQIVERMRSFPPESTAQLTISRPKTHPLFRRYRGKLLYNLLIPLRTENKF